MDTKICHICTQEEYDKYLKKPDFSFRNLRSACGVGVGGKHYLHASVCWFMQAPDQCPLCSLLVHTSPHLFISSPNE